MDMVASTLDTFEWLQAAETPSNSRCKTLHEGQKQRQRGCIVVCSRSQQRGSHPAHQPNHTMRLSPFLAFHLWTGLSPDMILALIALGMLKHVHIGKLWTPNDYL
jgi:hypothetical protein